MFIAWIFIHNLDSSGSFTLNAVNAPNGATIPHASSTNTDINLSAFQIQQIGALIYNGFDGSSSPPNNTFNQEFSAATQLAIWND